MHRFTKGATTLFLALALLLAGLGFVPSPVDAQTNPHQRGPDPSATSLEQDGPYTVATRSVSRWGASGFAGGTVYYPTANETFAGIAVSPGYTAYSWSLGWYGQRLASHGFVVFVIDTNTIYDFPDSRADQLQAALDHLQSWRTPSWIRARLDNSRLAVSGHSMGGGGALRASTNNPSLKAAVPLTPWHTTRTFNTSVPQLIVGSENDLTAPVAWHAIPFYNNLPSTTPKVYLELDGAGHFAPNFANATISRYSISWFKVFADEDARYLQFLCGVDHTANSAIGDYRTNANQYC
jgi:dienelactone hydrolase